MRQSPKLRHLRWYIAALLFAATVINYLDRQVIGVVKPRIMTDLHLNQIQYGHVVQFFLVAYSVMYVVSGFLVDRWGTRRSLAAFAAWWSTANVLHVFVRSAASLRLCQLLLGIGEPGNFNAGVRIASEWFPSRERATVNGLINAGATIGAIVAIPLVSWVLLHHTWRYAFAITGLLGLLWLIPWWLLYRLPREHGMITEAELSYIQKGSVALCEGEKPSVLQLLRRPDVWGLTLARFFSDPVWWFVLFWLPGYLQEQRGLTLQQLAWFGWLPYLASDIGGIIGGWISDRTICFFGSPVRARLWPMAVCAAAMPVSLLIPRLHSNPAMMSILCVLTFAHMAWKTNLMTITNDIYPVECIGTVFGILMVGSGIGGFLFQGVVARIVQNVSYNRVFTIMGFMHPSAFLCVYFFIRKHLLNRVITRPDRISVPC
jgi:ACS family hexuronate transporter-like MFS transporter